MFRCHHGQGLASDMGKGQGLHAPQGWTGFSLRSRAAGHEPISRRQNSSELNDRWRLAKRCAAFAGVLFFALLLPAWVAAQTAPSDQTAPAAQSPTTAQQAPAEQPAPQDQTAASASLPAPKPPKVTGWTAFEQIQASHTSLGAVMMLDTDVGYKLTEHASGDVGLPIIVTRSPFSPYSDHDYYWSPAWRSPYVDVKYSNVYQEYNYTSVLTGIIPAASEDRIFSTGRFGVDWFNHIEEPKENLLPFLNFGASNGAIDRFIMPRPYSEARPYQTLGFLGDVEPGVEYSRKRGTGKGVGIGASYYALVPAGPQKVFSRLVLPYSALGGDGQHLRYFDTNFETTQPGQAPIAEQLLLVTGTGQFDSCSNVNGTLTCKDGLASIARDNGYSAWLHITRWQRVDIQLGYTRSVHYHLDVYTLAITFDGTSLIRRFLMPL